MATSPFRIAATSDIHYGKNSAGKMRELFTTASESADVVLICGDLTDYGHANEAKLLAEDLRRYARVPVFAVLGNHDFESGEPQAVREILENAGVKIFDGECCELDGVGFAGVCGFGGGFGARMLSAWGEPIIKSFVQEAVDQALKLEQALARLHTEHRVVLLHYAPIAETVAGEPLEIFPFLGSSRLEGPLNRFNVTVAFHGHAHNGAAEGRTMMGVPVFNVAAPVLAKINGAPLFRSFEIPRGTA